MGIQPWADIIGDPMVDIEANSHGVDKFYPYGPTCVVGGKNVESYTSDILTDVMKYLDKKWAFDWTEADPFRLLVGHGSRFEMPFLNYINDPASKWMVSIGVPYGTSLWQVGNSSQQMVCTRCASLLRSRNC